MTIPFPSRLPLFPAFVLICILGFVELVEGTAPQYCCLVLSFFFLSVLAFNNAGGFSRPSGGYIAFYALLVVEIGTVYKAVVGQPAQSNLEQPLLMMGTYVATMAILVIVAFVSRNITTTRDGVAGIMGVNINHNFTATALGCLVVHLVLMSAILVLPNGGGQVLHSLAIVDPFLLLSVVLGTIGAVYDSRRQRSTNVLTIPIMAYLLGSGLLSFSKQGMMLPMVCWMLGIAWSRFSLKPIHLAAIGLYAVCSFQVFEPISANRNDVSTGSFADRYALITHYLTHLGELHERAASWQAEQHSDEKKLYYYGQAQGLWDRLSMMPNDAMLISYSDQGHYRGYVPILYYFRRLVPHAIDSDRKEDKSVGGNGYAHEMGGLADADTSTGISFSPTAEAYHLDGWRGVLVLQPAIFLLLFVVVDSVAGDLRRNPWGLFLTLSFAHIAPEAMLGGAITAMTYGSSSIVLAVFVCGYVAPVFGQLFGNAYLKGQRGSAMALP